jgi:propanol-preferring alcohol dehydrogenase
VLALRDEVIGAGHLLCHGERATTMRAMVFNRPGEPLRLADLPVPEPDQGQVQLRVQVCGVCRTDLHLVDGELPDPKLPVIPGH